jgi:hypothetical protein
MFKLSQVLQFYPPLHALHSPETKLYPITQAVHDLLLLHERSGLQAPVALSQVNPPTHEVQFVACFSVHYLHGSRHCSVQLLLINLNPGLQSLQVPLAQVLHLGGHGLH